MANTQNTTAANKAPTQPNGIQKEVWDQYQSAFSALLEDLLERNAGGNGVQVAAPDGEKLHAMVTDAVSAVLVESNLLEKFVVKTVQNYFKEEGGKLQEKLIPKDKILEVCRSAFQSFSMHQVGPALAKQIRSVVQSKLLEFGNSEEFKAMLDSRFRTMEQYLRSDVVPRAVKQTLKV